MPSFRESLWDVLKEVTLNFGGSDGFDPSTVVEAWRSFRAVPRPPQGLGHSTSQAVPWLELWPIEM